jgi:multiple sugar transport system substrate-binding protein
VWTDITRLAGFKLYAKEHPNVHFQYEINGTTGSADTVNGLTLAEKTLLSNRVGSGWPDIAFEGDTQNFPTENNAPVSYSVNLDGLIPSSVIKGFPKAVLSFCEVNGGLYCLKNDSAQNVLWYNETLMKKFGYSVPNTWQQYQALGETVAKQHPGYIIGDISGRYGEHAYFDAAQCPYEAPTKTNVEKIDTTDPYCVAMAKLLQPLVDDGTVTSVDPFAAGFPKLAPQILMMPAADWFGGYLGSLTPKDPNHSWGAALPLKWGNSGVRWTGDEGGGVYMVSSHSPDLSLAVSVIQWMATDTSSSGFQAHGGTFPAYTPAQAAWGKNNDGGDGQYYYNNVVPVWSATASLIWPGFRQIGIDDISAFALSMTLAASRKQSLVKELPAWGSSLVDLAKAAGYQVTTS